MNSSRRSPSTWRLELLPSCLMPSCPMPSGPVPRGMPPRGRSSRGCFGWSWPARPLGRKRGGATSICRTRSGPSSKPARRAKRPPNRQSRNCAARFITPANSSIPSDRVRNPIYRPTFSRRAFLERTAMGFGSLALSHLLARELAASEENLGGTDLRPRAGHFPPRAKAVILLMQNGGPSQVDLFDPKPELNKRSGQKHPQKVESFQPGSQANLLMGSPFKFHRHGQCGMELSELLPHIGSVADDLCLVRSMVCDNNNHPQGLSCLTTGKIFPGRPTFGAWVSYALGTLNQDLPAYVVLRDPDGYNNGGTTLWENGWL